MRRLTALVVIMRVADEHRERRSGWCEMRGSCHGGLHLAALDLIFYRESVDNAYVTNRSGAAGCQRLASSCGSITSIGAASLSIMSSTSRDPRRVQADFRELFLPRRVPVSRSERPRRVRWSVGRPWA